MDENYREATIQLPEAASTLAPMVDGLYSWIFWVSTVSFVLIVGFMVAFAWYFRRRRGVTSKPPGHNNTLELFWTFLPVPFLVVMFHYGFEGYMFMSVPPENAIDVRVQGSAGWAWSYEQPNGLQDSVLRVPVDRPVRLIMSSIPSGSNPAVLHSFFVPAFRIKRDLVPGMFTSVWFEATREGTYQVYCTEYCGSGHSAMLSTVEVMSQEDYDAYLERGPGRPDEYPDDIAWGESLFAQNACIGCHNRAEGAGRLVGPNLWGVAGSLQPVEGEGDVLADADYLRTSIWEPASQIVEGYPNQMPSYAHLPISVRDALVAYIASLSPENGASVLEALEEGDEGDDTGG
ncbi:MAG: cytochrome c oxidase subunit II [Sandaracinaceae bacterium]